jgi:dephospho-CoA kinase
MAALTIGLTGGIASGKSLVERRFRALGVPVLDADQVARDVVAPGEPALTEITDAFGSGVLAADGSLDRRKLREAAFADTALRDLLQRITHPRILQRMAAWRQAQSAPYCVLSIPLLVESGLQRAVDRVLVVDAPEAVQIRRLMDRDGIDETLAQRMVRAQSSRSARLAVADDVLDNSGTTQQVADRIDGLHRTYLRLAHQRADH